jgi:hypothetical protein
MTSKEHLIIHKAQKNLAELEVEHAELKKRLSENHEKQMKLRVFMETYAELLPSTDNLTSNGKSIPDSSSVESAKEKIVRIAVSLLTEHNPRSTLDLLMRVEQKGVEVGGKNKSVYLANILSTDDRFVSRRKFGGWFLVENDPLKIGAPVVTATGASLSNQSPDGDENIEDLL